MQVSVTQIKAKFSAIAQHADAGEEVIITTRGRPAYRLLPVIAEPRRIPFPDVTALAKQSKSYKPAKKRAQTMQGQPVLWPTGVLKTSAFSGGCQGYIDTSVLVSAFSNEPLQPVTMALLQAPHWDQVCASDWTVAEFTCAMQAKLLRGETPPEVAHTIHQTVKNLFTQDALHRIAVLRDDYATVQRIVPSLNCPVRGADALHLAVASRSNITHFASLDKTPRVAAGHWLEGIECVPEA